MSLPPNRRRRLPDGPTEPRGQSYLRRAELVRFPKNLGNGSVNTAVALAKAWRNGFASEEPPVVDEDQGPTDVTPNFRRLARS